MKETFEKYRALLERVGDLNQKRIDHCEVIDSYYADQLEQVENSAAPIIGKERIKKMELKNLEGVRSVKTTLKNIVIDEASGLVWGEMIIQFDSIKSGKKILEEAFMQRWENDEIVFLRFFYGGFLED